jgi:cyclopropane-fatty-acyl-phospholipid synthase
MFTAHPLPSPLEGSASTASLNGWLLRQVARRVGAPRLRYALGRAVVGPREPVATIRFADRRALLGLAVDPERHFGDAYAEGRIEVEGELVDALQAAYRGLSGRGAGVLARLSLLVRHTPHRSRSNVHRHYDLGNDFYLQWLDPELVYTCAYFDSPATPLDTAQAAKLELVCRKLALRPGERVAEAGCG